MNKHHYKLVIEYDGTQYVGWQRQPNLPTVQGQLEQALQKLFKEKIAVMGASRTDSGVHALGQVASFYTTLAIPAQGVLRGLNSLLPADIRILSAKKLKHDFHPIREAKGKIYRYIILNDEFCSALLQNRAWYINVSLNLREIKKAAECFVGKHDFTSFMGRDATVKNAIRTIDSISVATSRKDFFGIGKLGPEGKYIIFTFKGKGFVKHQIRNIMGIFVEVGKGKRLPEDIPKILKAKARKAAGRMAPAAGLYLVRVTCDITSNTHPCGM